MKRLIFVLLGGLIVSAVQAASFDCGKAATKVEKLICADAAISKLDEELAVAYKTALQNEKQAVAVRQTQKLWLKERNGCVDEGCVKRAYEKRLHGLLNVRAVMNQKGASPFENLATNQKEWFGSPVRKKNITFCSGFLADFKEQRGIEHIKPVVQTDNYDDPAMMAYRQRCPVRKLNKNIDLDPRILRIYKEDYEEARKSAPDDLDEAGFGTGWLATRNFQIYEIELDSNKKNGKEYLIYAETWKKLPNYEEIKIPNRSEEYADYTEYSQFDFKKCDFIDSIQLKDPSTNFKNDGLFQATNRVIVYQGKPYVYSIENEGSKDETSLNISLHGKVPWKGKETRFEEICKFYGTDVEKILREQGIYHGN